MEMLRLCTFFALTYVALCAPTLPDDKLSTIVKYESTNDGKGNYYFSYETTDGTKRQEAGNFINKGQEDEHMVVTGSYSYTDPNGKLVSIQYTGDENGYHIISPLPPGQIQQIPFGGVSPNVVASLLGK